MINVVFHHYENSTGLCSLTRKSHFQEKATLLANNTYIFIDEAQILPWH